MSAIFLFGGHVIFTTLPDPTSLHIVRSGLNVTDRFGNSVSRKVVLAVVVAG